MGQAAFVGGSGGEEDEACGGEGDPARDERGHLEELRDADLGHGSGADDERGLEGAAGADEDEEDGGGDYQGCSASCRWCWR